MCTDGTTVFGTTTDIGPGPVRACLVVVFAFALVIVGPPITRSTARKYRDMLVALVGG